MKYGDDWHNHDSSQDSPCMQSVVKIERNLKWLEQKWKCCIEQNNILYNFIDILKQMNEENQTTQLWTH